MKWNELDVIVSKTATDLVALLLYECGSNGSIIHDDEEDEEGRIRITAYFPEDVDEDDRIVDRVRREMAALEERTPVMDSWKVYEREKDDASWLYAWQDHFHAQKITPHFWVTPAWETAEPGPDEDVLIIDPGMAFGSGVHVTTSMCLSYLEQVMKEGDYVLDIGTGTGILALGAAKLGASHVTAVDNDPKAVGQAQINIGLNEDDGVVNALEGDLLSVIPQDGTKADVIVANLVTNAVLALLPSVAAYTHDGSYLIVSGIIDDRIGEVRACAAEEGWREVDGALKNGWYALVLRREP